LATILGLFVAAGGLVFTGLQLKVANDQSKQSAEATELQAFGSFNHEISEPAELKGFKLAAKDLVSLAGDPRRHQLPFRDIPPIIDVAGQYDHLAKLFLADRAALPHARLLFAQPMACSLLDFELIRTRVSNLRLFHVPSLIAFTHTARCPAQVLVNGIAIGFPE
jgi:hypothetical protein